MTTEIICTIGPASHSKEMIEKLALSGMNILRNNFAHCTFSEYEERLAIVKEINKKHGLNVKMQQDLRGPIIRLGGDIPVEGISVDSGDILNFVTTPCKDKSEGDLVIDDPYLHVDVKKNEPILIASGALELVITNVIPERHRFSAKVIRGGVIYPRKAVNLPTTKLTTSSLTEKDIRDLKFALKTGVDFVAMSFVSSAEDIEKIRKIIGDHPVQIFAKIERREALNNIDEIIQASDGIIVARGDLGVEIPFEEVPVVQKRIISKCQRYLKPVIVATNALFH
ncbi:MAG TPA: pyruvate kinase, partial [bacterium]|nr:pyruvate kinase [bacterium]